MNAAAILTMLDGGHNYHVGLIMDASVYANLSVTPDTKPPEPVLFATNGA